MKKILLKIIILMLLTSNLMSIELNDYLIIKINDIQSGKEEGMIGWQKARSGLFSGPTAMEITINNIIYIPDRVNFRINVYDLNFKFIKTIIEKTEKKGHYAQLLKSDSNGNIIYLIKNTGLVKINLEGENIFNIKSEKLPEQVIQQKEFFPIDEKIFIYNDKNEVAYIDEVGYIETPNKAAILLMELSKRNVNKYTIEIPATKRQIIENLKMDNKHIIIDDTFYSSLYSEHKKYYEEIKEIREYIKAEKLKLNSTQEHEINLNLDEFSLHFIDYDRDHNSYWMGIGEIVENKKKYAILILSKYGELIDAFYYGQYKRGENPGFYPDFSLYPTSGAEVAVAPNGDVYFLVGSKEKYTLYKVERRW